MSYVAFALFLLRTLVKCVWVMEAHALIWSTEAGQVWYTLWNWDTFVVWQIHTIPASALFAQEKTKGGNKAVVAKNQVFDDFENDLGTLAIRNGNCSSYDGSSGYVEVELVHMSNLQYPIRNAVSPACVTPESQKQVDYGGSAGRNITELWVLCVYSDKQRERKLFPSLNYQCVCAIRMGFQNARYVTRAMLFWENDVCTVVSNRSQYWPTRKLGRWSHRRPCETWNGVFELHKKRRSRVEAGSNDIRNYDVARIEHAKVVLAL